MFATQSIYVITIDVITTNTRHRMINQTRRTLLKGLGAVAIAPTTAMASGLGSASEAVNQSGSALPVCDLTIYQHQTGSSETITLMNLTGKTVTLDEISPIGLSDIHGSLQVRVNLKERSGVILKPGQRLSFDVVASTAHAGPNTHELSVPNVIAGHVRVKSSHPAFNGIIPVTAFDAQVA